MQNSVMVARLNVTFSPSQLVASIPRNGVTREARSSARYSVESINRECLHEQRLNPLDLNLILYIDNVIPATKKRSGPDIPARFNSNCELMLELTE